jgi:tyrosyl-tRNA synthetase
MKLAKEIVAIYHSDEAAGLAEAEFVRVFQQHDLPEEIPDFTLQDGQSVLDVLVAGGLVLSRGEGKRMLQQRAVRLDGETLQDGEVCFPHPGVLQVGKRRYLRVRGG